MKQNRNPSSGIRIKAYSTKEIAELYNVSGRTLTRWLVPFSEEIGQRRGHYFTPKQTRIIFEKIGLHEMIYLN